jgi:hypothetical protein
MPDYPDSDFCPECKEHTGSEEERDEERLDHDERATDFNKYYSK